MTRNFVIASAGIFTERTSLTVGTWWTSCPTQWLAKMVGRRHEHRLLKVLDHRGDAVAVEAQGRGIAWRRGDERQRSGRSEDLLCGVEVLGRPALLYPCPPWHHQGDVAMHRV